MASYLKASIERSYAESFLSELERNENQYFLFIGKGTAWQNENIPSAYSDTIKSEYQIMNDAVGYKKLNPENILFALPRYEWTSGTVYDQYDDNIDLFDSNDPSIFYVVTDENNIYKCLSNGNGSASTEKPSQVLTTPFNTSDGYTWKYLATVKESNLPFELTDYIPVDVATVSNDTETQNQYNAQIEAVNGSITRMVITNSDGASAGVYPNTIVRGADTNTAFVLDVATFTQTADPSVKVVKITETISKSRINAVTNLLDYIGYVLRVESSTQNTSQVNNYGVITNVSVTGSNNDIEFTVKNDAIDFIVAPSGNGNYASVEIVPYVKIVGNGTGAYAFPVMSSSKTITGMNVVDGGKDYSIVLSEITSPKTSVTNHPTVRAVVAPKGGHGSNILKELNVKDILIVVDIGDSDSEKIRGGGSYRQFGIIKNPVLGDGTGVVAGKENLYYRDITVIPTDGIITTSDFGLGEANLLIGTETYASCKVVAVKSYNSATITLKTLNTSGKFITKQDRPDDYVLTLSNGNGNNFTIGEIVSQTIPAGTIIGSVTYSFTLVITGKVIEKTPTSLTVRLISAGNFVISPTVSVIGQSSSTTDLISQIKPRYGELIWVTNTTASVSSFLTKSSNQKLYKIVDVGQAYFDLDNTPSYRGLHILSLSTSVNGASGALDTTISPLTQTSFSNGDVVHQGITGQFGHYATGVVYDWEFINNANGKLYLTNVVGTFKNVIDNGITGSQLGNYIVAGVSLPDIDRTSGEVLYIDNVRPIQRSTGQQEEFRLRLGF